MGRKIATDRDLCPIDVVTDRSSDTGPLELKGSCSLGQQSCRAKPGEVGIELRRGGREGFLPLVINRRHRIDIAAIGRIGRARARIRNLKANDQWAGRGCDACAEGKGGEEPIGWAVKG